MDTMSYAGPTPASAAAPTREPSSVPPCATAAESNRDSVDVIDFFCGCGGTSAGLRTVGMNILAGIDLDRDASETYRTNFPEAAFIERDIRNIEPAEVSDLVVRTSGSRLLFSACAPCQPYTGFHRKSARRAEQRTLLLRLMPFIDHMQPDFVFIENVPGLHKVPKASTFNRLRASLERRGYSIDWTIVDCRDYGVPQRRGASRSSRADWGRSRCRRPRTAHAQAWRRGRRCATGSRISRRSSTVRFIRRCPTIRPPRSLT